jgi:hypothetical protein
MPVCKYIYDTFWNLSNKHRNHIYIRKYLYLMVFYSLPDESSSPTSTVRFFDVDVSFHCGAAAMILFLEPGGRPRLRPDRLDNRTLLSSTVKHVRVTPGFKKQSRCISYMCQEDNTYNNRVYRDKCHNNIRVFIT